MNEEVVDEVTSLEVVEGAQHQSKEDEYSLKPESRRLLKPQEILIPAENDYSHSPPQEYDDIRQGKNVVETVNPVTTSEHPQPGFFLDDGGFIVEELTVKSYNGSSLDIGTSNSRERVYNRQNQWRHLYQLSRDLGAGNSLSHTGYGKHVQATSDTCGDIGSASSQELLAKNPLSDDQSNVMEHVTTAENKQGAGVVHGGIRTKIISKSGFSEYFVKHTLKGKGIVCRNTSSDGFHVDSGDQNQMKVCIGTNKVDSNVSLSFGSKTDKSSSYSSVVPRSKGSDGSGVTLREWLKVGNQNVSKAERLYIFRKIVDLVDSFHSQEVALHNLRPSYIKLLPSNQIMYLGLPIHKQISGNVVNSEVLPLEESLVGKRVAEQVFYPSCDMRSKKQKFNENVTVARRWNQFLPRADLYFQTTSDIKVNAVGSQDSNKYEEDVQLSKHGIQRMYGTPCISNEGHLQLISITERLEDTWYTSPEGGCTRSSNIFCLGVLLFEVCIQVGDILFHYSDAISLCSSIILIF